MASRDRLDPDTVNRELSVVRKAIGWWLRQGWITTDPTFGIERRPSPPDKTKALSLAQVAAVWRLEGVALRDKTLWRLLYESAARAEEVLCLNVEDLFTADKRGRITPKCGAIEWIHWQSGAAQLLPRLIAGRTEGPLFLTERRAPTGTPTMDVCPVTSRARLSYRRAEEIFEESTRLLANPLARPEQWTELRGLTAVAVVLGLLTAQRFGVAAGGALAEVGRVLPDALRDRVAALRDTLEFTAAAREGAMPDSAVLLLPASAVRERRRVRLVYRWSWKGETGERDRRSGHALRARVRLRPRPPARPGADVPGRPGGPGPAAAADEVPGDFDAVAHLTRSLAAVPYAHEVEVVLETSLAEARRRIPATVATLSGTDGAVTVRLRAERLDGVARMLAGLGVPFVIRGPGELRAVVRRLGRDLLRSAEAGEDA